MSLIVNLLYAITMAIIRTYKFFEWQFLKLINDLLTKEIIRRGETLGIFVHMPNKINNNEISLEDKCRVLINTKYSTIFLVKVKNSSIFRVGMSLGMLGIAEAYSNGDWEFMGSDEELVEMMTRVFESNLFQVYYHPIKRLINYLELRLRVFNLKTKKKAFEVVKKDYDLGTELFKSFLEPWMQYSCGYWARADNLTDSQIQKLELIAKKLDLKPGMRVLDVGCGWGTLCKYLVENYGVECVGISCSKEGVKYAEENCQELKTEFRLQDYRELNEKFDRIVSIECLEYLGGHNYRKFFEVAHKCLKDDGIFLVQTFGVNHSDFPLTNKYILPNASFPYYLDLAKSMEGLFIIEDWHNFGLDYSKTFNAWRYNFPRNWTPNMRDEFGNKFFREFNFYLVTTEALFRSSKLQLWQLVLSRNGLQREYRAAR